MIRSCIPGITFLLLAGFAVAAEDGTEASAPAPHASTLEEVLVTGEHPGPALWKVSSGDHVLWILGEVSPLPARLKWRSRQFESLLATSQEVLLDIDRGDRPTQRQLQRRKSWRTYPMGRR
jgi:hypothetical protein